MYVRSLVAALVATALVSPTPAQSISRISAPAINKPWTIDYTSTPGNLYVMMFSTLPLGSIPVPGIGGTFQLNPVTLTVFYGGGVPGGGTDSRTFGLPNDPSLVNGCLALQAIDILLPATYTFSNAVEACFSRGIGTILVSEAVNITTTLGDSELKTVVNAAAGAPVTTGLRGPVLGITHYGQSGFRPLVTAAGTTGNEQADLDVDKGTAVVQDARDPINVHLQMPNGFDIYVRRDFANQKQFFLQSVNRATGVVTELTGSRFTDLGALAQPASMYRAQFAFTADGATGLCVVHDSTNTPTPIAGPPDRLLLFKTDPGQTFANNLNVFDASPVAGPNAMQTSYNGSLRICAGGIGMVEGEEPSGLTGEAALWAGPTDGSAQWTRVAMPNTGTGLPFYWSYSLWRTNPTGDTNVFPIGGNVGLSTDHMDVVAIRNIGAGPLTAVNITAFPTNTQVQTPGNSGIGLNNLRAALSPDGNNVAIVLGANSVASPGRMAVVRTDGSQAGAVTAFTDGQFAAQVVVFCEPWFISNSKLIFTAGSSTTAMDYYLYDLNALTIVNLTLTTTGSTIVPFTNGGTAGNIAVRGSFMSNNGAYYYFARGYTTAAVGTFGSDWKAINTATNAVFDVSGGAFQSVRPVSTTIATWFSRRNAANELFFTSGRNMNLSTSFGDDEIFKFNPEAGTPISQVTANNGTGTSTANVKRIQDLVLQPGGNLVAYAQGVGILTTVAEDLFTVPQTGGAVTKISRTPASGGQGIARGSVYFTPSPVDGLVWVQGTNARINPSLNTVGYWNSLVGSTVTAPLRITAAPIATTKSYQILNVSPLNP